METLITVGNCLLRKLEAKFAKPDFVQNVRHLGTKIGWVVRIKFGFCVLCWFLRGWIKKGHEVAFCIRCT